MPAANWMMLEQAFHQLQTLLRRVLKVFSSNPIRKASVLGQFYRMLTSIPIADEGYEP
jgi:hypothetical protein